MGLVNLDCLTYAGHLESLSGLEKHPKYIFEKHDLLDKASVLRVVQEHRSTHVMHLAAESHIDRSIEGPGDFIQTNIVGTFNLLEACRACWGGVSGLASGLSGGEGESPVPHSQFPIANIPAPHSQLPIANSLSSLPQTPDAIPQTLGGVAPDPRRQTLSPRFLHVSTDEVYGSLGPTGAFTETTPYAPNSPYAASKASSDMLVRAYHHTYSLPALITNCSNNYGPYQFPEKLIPVVIQSVLARKPIPVYGNGLNVRDWLFVQDHAEAMWQVLTRGRNGETYNIGGNSECPNIRIVDLICDTIDELRVERATSPSSAATCRQEDRQAGSPPGQAGGLFHPEQASDSKHVGTSRKLITFVKDRPGHDLRYAIDATKIRSELGWKPAHTFEHGIRETVKWYLEHQDWVGKVTARS